MLEDVGNWILQMPDFIHNFGEVKFSDGSSHTFRGSIMKHISIEKPLYAWYRVLDFIGDGFPLRDLLKIPQIIGFGLNCGFPCRDIAQYLIWYLRGCKPIKSWNKGELGSL